MHICTQSFSLSPLALFTFPASLPSPPFKYSMFQIIKVQEKSTWLSSKQTADKREGSHLANNHVCCIGLSVWANKSQQRWVTLRKSLRWRLTALWWCQCWVLFTKSSVPNRPFRYQHFGVIHNVWDPALQCLQSSLRSWEYSEPTSRVRTRMIQKPGFLQSLA